MSRPYYIVPLRLTCRLGRAKRLPTRELNAIHRVGSRIRSTQPTQYVNVIEFMYYNRIACWLSGSLLTVLLTASQSHAADSPAPDGQITRSHARALYGQPFYPADFQHFNYINPNAPASGTLRLGAQGTFDTFNAFTTKGVPASISGHLYDSLMVRSRDEPYTLYGLIAEAVEYPASNRWVRFYLNPKARFADGKPITAADVKFTFDQFNSKDAPIYRSALDNVESVKVESVQQIIFYLNDSHEDNRLLPFQIAQLPILPSHDRERYDFSRADFTLPLSSGAYTIKSYEPGKQVILREVENYWAKNHPVRLGHNNFRQIQYDYFRNATVSLQAFLAGGYDIRLETIAKNWSHGYTGKAVETGKIIQTLLPRKTNQIQAFVFNTSSTVFKDRRVRQAISQGYDFQWTNRTLMYNNYQQPHSLFANSEFGQRSAPDSGELKLLQTFRQKLPVELFTQQWQPVKTSGDGNIRAKLQLANSLLQQSGWVVKKQQRVNRENGQVLSFELLLTTPEQERIVLPFQRNLKQLGVQMRVKTVDLAQYIQRVKNKDYDMLLRTISHGTTPGNELQQYWHSQYANEQGSQNVANVSNPVVDAILAYVRTAKTLEELITATRALDRILLWEYYLIPQLQAGQWRVAHRSRLGYSSGTALNGHLDFTTWWEKAKND